MPSKAYWVDEPNIMSADYYGAVSTEDLDNALMACLVEVEKKAVHLVVDMSGSESFPTNVLKLASLNKLTSHANARWFAFVKPPTLVRFAMQIFHRHNSKIFATREEALAFLREQVQEAIGIVPPPPAVTAQLVASPTRTDLIAAWLVKQWLQQHAPDVAANWTLEVDEAVKQFAARVKGMYQDMDAVFASQTALAATAIRLWNLQEVVLLGGGAPTPLSPKPEQIRLFTDVNPAVLEDAKAAGYPTAQVDVHHPDDLTRLAGAKSAIATGLFHFLPNEGIQKVLNNIASVGIHTVVFNNVAPTAKPLMDQWTKLGFQMYARTIEEMKAIIPPGWELQEYQYQADFIKHHPLLGEKLAQQQSLYHVYLVTHAGS